MRAATAQPQFGLAGQAPRPGLDQHSPLAQPGLKKALALYGRTVAVKRSAAAKSIQALRVPLRPAGMPDSGITWRMTRAQGKRGRPRHSKCQKHNKLQQFH